LNSRNRKCFPFAPRFWGNLLVAPAAAVQNFNNVCCSFAQTDSRKAAWYLKHLRKRSRHFAATTNARIDTDLLRRKAGDALAC
jgi:hypothetical protein